MSSAHSHSASVAALYWRLRASQRARMDSCCALSVCPACAGDASTVTARPIAARRNRRACTAYLEIDAGGDDADGGGHVGALRLCHADQALELKVVEHLAEVAGHDPR